MQAIGAEKSDSTFDLSSKEDSQVECLQIVDISERSHFHFIIRSKSANGDGHAVEIKGTENVLTAGDQLKLSTLVVGDKFHWSFSLMAD